MPASTHTTTLLDARALRYGYGSRDVLAGVDVGVRPGEVVALLGPNGAGKTTLLKLLAGLLKPNAGTIDGRDSVRVGWVPQGGGVHGRLTVRENLRAFARLTSTSFDEIPGAIDSVGLEPWTNTPASELSGGLRQRLNVAVGLLGSPQVLLLDEPTTGLDLEHRVVLEGLLRRRAADGCGVLHTTHDIEDARHADRVIVLAAGRIVWDGDFVGIETIAPDVVLPDTLATVTDPAARGLLRAWAKGRS